jgi:redox-sensitive bicupin YhaK (pirin superfamily)
MKKIHYSSERGESNLGWLKSKFSFSFSNYHNLERNGFGKLLVLNDDWIAPGKGFLSHSHDNMEIITLVYSGELMHKDSIGNTEVIKEGEMQVMSAGRGITHSEFNNLKDKSLELFQIWIETSKEDIMPRHAKKFIDLKPNEFNLMVSGDKKDNSLFIHQDAKIFLGKFDKETKVEYHLSKGRGIFAFVIDGKCLIDGDKLSSRDSIEIKDIDKFEIHTDKGLYLMIIDVPL